MRYVDFGNLSVLEEQKKKKRRKKLILSGAFLVGIGLVAIIGYFAYAFYWPLSAALGQILKNPKIALSFFRNPSGEIKSTDGKTNILILGIDKRDNVPYTFLGPNGQQQHNGFLSDTIIIASIDQKTKKVSMVSVPRDTWVSLPSWQDFPASQGKINSAYSLGDLYDYPGGGLALAENVISDKLGIPIHYGVRIDFDGFRKLIDTLGGVDITVERSFDDYEYPIEGKESADCSDGTYSCRFKHLHFDAGLTHMNGETALGYSRSREGTNGEGSDFARARRQQKVIQAVFKKAMSLNNFLDPIKLNNMSREFGESIESNFDLAALPGAIKLAKGINMNNVQTFVLDPSTQLMVVGNPDQYGGAYVIIPKNNNWGPVKLKVRAFLGLPSQ